jgi:hypothetical protein
MNMSGHEDLEWFRPPERNTLLHCLCVVLSLKELVSLSEGLCELESLPCNVVCLPFYRPREQHTRMMSPDMWAQEHNGRNTL